MTPYARVVADSTTVTGRRLTTFEVRFHRFVLAELNTHRVFSRNSASSRAIPVTKQLRNFLHDPAMPLVWASEQKGMQGGPPLEGADLDDAMALFEHWQEATGGLISDYLASHPIDNDNQVRLHKSLINRLMEPEQWHVAVLSSTAWENFLRQRVSPLAQPEIRVLAELMLDAYKNSTPRLLQEGEYHLPYVWDDEDTLDWADKNCEPFDLSLVKISAARCARVSYLTQNGVRDPQEDLVMHDRLTAADPMHASPLEHPATPAPWNEQKVRLMDAGDGAGWRPIPLDSICAFPTKILELPVVGNFLGWRQHRLGVEMAADWQSFS